ncbi:hypothetical protein D9619_002539 [Psilocybe cf. subviscida]|uniref:F-box domain-containing protein n=1 Tax=Psilocybe cf. subviscida TaxID=2480587 RepID=A0A8H5AY45_9AGAR|nr:hypothetical protein D9619_002539 [Psilocybe cf. subviscida]
MEPNRTYEVRIIIEQKEHTPDGNDRGNRQGSIYTLPPELLHYIFDRRAVPVNSLYSLALTSRKFSAFAVPLYLKRFNIDTYTVSQSCDIHFRDISLLDIPHLPDALSGLLLLAASGYLRSMESLTIGFGDHAKKQPVNFRVVEAHIYRLTDFLKGMAYIGEVTLKWSGILCGCCDTLKTDPGNAELEIGLWTDALTGLMNLLVQKKCKMLTVSEGQYMAHTYTYDAHKSRRHFQASRARKSIFANLPLGLMKILNRRRASLDSSVDLEMNLMKSDGWHWVRASGTGTEITVARMSPEARAAHQLTTLHLQSPMFLMPPMLPWTISALSLSSLTTLSISHLAFTPRQWASFLALVAAYAPRLRFFHIVHARAFASADVQSLLMRLPLLMHLLVGHTVRFIDGYTALSAPWPAFEHLEELGAPAEWVAKLLIDKLKGLPRLRVLSISYGLGMNAGRPHGLEHWLRRTRTQTESIPSLIASGEAQRSQLTILIEVYLGSTPLTTMRDDVELSRSNRQHSNQGGSSRHVVPMLNCVHELKLVFNAVHTDASADDSQMAHIFPQWISLFVALRTLIITCNVARGIVTHQRAVRLAKTMLRSGALPDSTSISVNGLVVTV